jgi:hypothetical protein
MFDSESATPWLEITDGAMPVQNERWWLPTALTSPDRLNGLARPDYMVPNPLASVTAAIAIDQCSGVSLTQIVSA